MMLFNINSLHTVATKNRASLSYILFKEGLERVFHGAKKLNYANYSKVL